MSGKVVGSGNEVGCMMSVGDQVSNPKFWVMCRRHAPARVGVISSNIASSCSSIRASACCYIELCAQAKTCQRRCTFSICCSQNSKEADQRQENKSLTDLPGPPKKVGPDSESVSEVRYPQHTSYCIQSARRVSIGSKPVGLFVCRRLKSRWGSYKLSTCGPVMNPFSICRDHNSVMMYLLSESRMVISPDASICV